MRPAAAPRGSGTWWASPAQSGWGRQLLAAGYTDPPDIAAEGIDVRVVAGKNGMIRLIEPGGASISLTNGFDPEVEIWAGKARVAFNRASGGTADGIYFTRQT